ncbi:MAG: ATP-grasp domain-containing protein [Cyanobacteria bacterium J06638_22]
MEAVIDLQSESRRLQSTCTIPQVILANTCEPFIRFFQRAGAKDYDALVQAFLQGGERALYWATPSSLPPPKLVVTSTPIPHFAEVQIPLGFAHTQWIAPDSPSASLCRDLLHRDDLMAKLNYWAGDAGALELIPYATTDAFMELLAALRQQGIAVYTPESVDEQQLGLRAYLGTKAGCRGVMTQVLGSQMLPESYLAPSIDEAVAIAQTFVTRQQPFLIKPNDGCLGIGQTRFVAPPFPSPDEIRAQLQHNPFLQNNLLVVEAFITARNAISPSVEVVIPRNGMPQILLVCIQQFSSSGHYMGEVVSRSWRSEPWYRPLTEAAMAIAQHLQRIGYVGHFDLDSLIDDTGTPYFIEFNPRRTGGSHIHDLGVHLLGDTYLEQAALLSQTGLSIPAFPSIDACISHMQPWFYPIGGKPQGIVVTHSATIPQQKLGYVAIAPDLESVLALNQKFLQHLNV